MRSLESKVWSSKFELQIRFKIRMTETGMQSGRFNDRGMLPHSGSTGRNKTDRSQHSTEMVKKLVC